MESVNKSERVYKVRNNKHVTQHIDQEEKNEKDFKDILNKELKKLEGDNNDNN